MTETYLKDTAEQLNKVFQLYKKKLAELPKKSDEPSDDVSDWFGSTMNDFVALGESIEDADVRNFVDHFSVSCLADLQDKFQGERITRYRWVGRKTTDYIEEAEVGDSFLIGNVTLEVKRKD